MNILVDIGNSRVKFCRTDCNGLIFPVRAIGRDSTLTFDDVARDWQLPVGSYWGVASTDPAKLNQFVSWAEARGDSVITIDSPWQVPISAQVDFPEKVGMDRLLNALAAKRYLKPGEPAIIACAGSAVTVDLVDEAGFFQGGSIFPGFRLMAHALHDHTAKLPLIDARDQQKHLPGKNTEDAMTLGIQYTIAGGIDAIVRELASQCIRTPQLLLTGGDMTPVLSNLLQCRRQFPNEVRPTLTLEGLRLVVEYHS